MTKIVGKLSDIELNEIRQLYEKKIALENLVKIIDAENELMYTKVTSDYTNTLSLFQNWWDTTSKKYSWETVDEGHWTINFETNDVILVW